jgi:hypothetical protein
MNDRPVPTRHWRSYGDDLLPTGREARDEPFRAFPSWFMRITCDRCGKGRMLSEADTRPADMRLSYIIAQMRHDRLRRPGKAERRGFRAWGTALGREACIRGPWCGCRGSAASAPCKFRLS